MWISALLHGCSASLHLCVQQPSFPICVFESSYHAYSELLTCLLMDNHEILQLDSSRMKQMEVALDEKSYTSEELQYRTEKTGYALLMNYSSAVISI